MKNSGLTTDFRNVRRYGEDVDIDSVLDETERYIEFLEGKEERLVKMEEALNKVEDSKLDNKQAFLKFFEEFKE